MSFLLKPAALELFVTSVNWFQAGTDNHRLK